MADQPATNCKAKWRRLLQAELACKKAQDDLFTTCQDSLLELLHNAFSAQSTFERATAFRVTALIWDVDRRKEFFGDFLRLACQPTNPADIVSGRKAIYDLPRDWVLASIELNATKLLDLNDDWEFRRFLELCSTLDRELTLRVASRSAGHENREIRDAAEDFLSHRPPTQRE